MAEGVWGGCDFLWPDEVASEDGTLGWLSRADITDAAEALTVATEAVAKFRSESVVREQIQVTPVLMREESLVEAKIAGHEPPLWVECTERARASEPFWRVEWSVTSASRSADTQTTDGGVAAPKQDGSGV